MPELGVAHDLQVGAILPQDILHLILEIYFEFRETVVQADPDQLDAWTSPTWPVLPILTSSRLVYHTAIPLLYRDVHLRDSSEVERFLCDPAISSYAHVKSLSLPASKTWATTRIRDRMVQAVLSTTAADQETRNRFASSLEARDEIVARWARTKRPKISVVRLWVGRVRTMADAKVLEDLHYMFATGDLIIDQFKLTLPSASYLHWNRPDIAWRDCDRVTLTCNPSVYPVINSHPLPSLLPKALGDPTRPPLHIKAGWQGKGSGADCRVHRDQLRATGVLCVVTLFCRTRDCFPTITVGPDLEWDPNDHSLCWGSNVPSDVDTPPGYPDIKFRSDCQLDHTGEKLNFWDGTDRFMVTLLEHLPYISEDEGELAEFTDGESESGSSDCYDSTRSSDGDVLQDSNGNEDQGGEVINGA
ncbi:hypothetical protein FFLO_04087 [Filobasidium floriforme]|uniref:Uncharacterized protein n=2 Tax=Filobasidium floriforme TaxID=5210 RepID=A0A8K0JJE4_9TREE|nr:hypothetical protein FFLO_04087 [Filobasidium floriforme]